MNHNICKCERVNRFGGNWKASAVRKLFESWGQSQRGNGLYDIWRQCIADAIASVEDGQGATPSTTRMRAELLGGPLPLALQATDPILDRSEHIGYAYSFVAVDPRTGQALPDSGVHVISCGDDGKIFRESAGRGPQFSLRQNEFIAGQLLAQEALGVVLLKAPDPEY